MKRRRKLELRGRRADLRDCRGDGFRSFLGFYEMKMIDEMPGSETNSLSVVIDAWIFLVCAIGFGVGVCIAISALLALPANLGGTARRIAEWSVPSMCLAFAPFVLRQQRLAASLNAREQMKLLYAGCPAWMRWVLYTTIGLGAGLFFLPMLLPEPRVAHPAGNGEAMTISICGFAIMGYAGIGAQLYSLLKLRAARP